MLLLDRHPSARSPIGPEQGVIDDARRRQRLRRRRTAAACVLIGALVAGVAWASGGTARHSAAGGSINAGATARASRKATPAFNVRLVPRLDVVGVAGWCVVPEEHGRATGGACGGVPTPSQPFLQIFGSGDGGSSEQTQVAVTDPQITAVLVDGHRSVQTKTLPGLPYGLRAARVLTRAGAKLAALDAHGTRVTQAWSQTPRQATVRRWRYPQRQPSGACGLSVSALPAIATRGGAVATTLRPFPGQLIGNAFLPCAESEFRLGREPLKAMVVLDAAQPGARVADLPGLHPIRAAPGIFAGGGLTAMRSGNAWLVVGQGSGPAQRMLLLHHLGASLHLSS
jgi:hypothetical protein